MERDGLTRGRRKGLIISLALSILSLSLLLYFTWEEETLNSLKMINIRGLLLVSVLVVCLWTLEGLRNKVILLSLGSPIRLSLMASARIYLATFFCAGVTPWAIGEWPCYIYGLTRRQVPPGEAAAAALLRSFFTKIFFLLCSGMVIIFSKSLRIISSAELLFRGAFTAAALSFLAYFLIMFKPGIALAILELLHGITPVRKIFNSRYSLTKFFQTLLDEACRFRACMKKILSRGFFFLVLTFILTAVYWMAYFSIAPLLLWGLGLTPSLLPVISWQMIIVLVLTYVPLPGGSGVAEFGAASLFAGFVPSPLLGIFILAWRFFTYFVTLIAGAVSLFLFEGPFRSRE
ncbi:MAG TPA: flippase-like domain-containing protein [Firmicutes bacterium]|nr:flippase-like domain-containing protein [Bacillota bacterium]